MTDAQQALAQVREALAAGPTPGPWQKATDWSRAAVIQSTKPFKRVVCTGNQNNDDRFGAEDWSGATWVDADFIARCNPENIAAILAHVDAQAAEIERLTAERDNARERFELTANLLMSIHALLYPPPVTLPDGRTFVFRPEDPDPHTVLQTLSDRIRALPDEIAAINDAKEQR